MAKFGSALRAKAPRREEHMKRTKLALAALLLTTAAVSALVAATAGSAKRADVFKVAWIYVGPHNDAGWSQAHDEGRLAVQRAFGSKVQTTYKENIAPGPQLQQTVASLVQQGYKMIFGTSYGFFDKKLAAKYPDVKFEQATGTETAGNLSEYFGAGEDTIYLSGMAAGAASKSGKLGLVVAFPIPEVIRHSNAFTLGAQATHPGATVRLVWTNNWYDPAKEKKAAESLFSAGVDVLGQNVDSPATGQFAESKGIGWVGYDSNAQKFAPKSWLTAALYDWGIYYTKRVKEAMAGTWKPGFYYGNMRDRFTMLAPFGPKVSAATKAKIAAKAKAIENGTFNVFAGPLYDQSGKLRVPKGQTMQTLKGGTNSLYGMNWLVKGVIGSPTGK